MDLSYTWDMKLILPSLLFSLFFICNTLSAEIYKWKDEDGVTHYSSEPVENAKKAELPEINRGDVEIPSAGLLSCSNHGGINCQAGADEDGSVICYDGFTEASPRYRFSCLSPKLQITEVSEVNEDGTFTVMVRNSKSVAASMPAVLYRPEHSPTEHKLSGPDKVEAFGVSEFKFVPRDADIPLSKPDLAQLSVKCANCP